jgi:hypothetical protein
VGSFKNRRVGVGSFKNLGVGVGAFVYRLLSPGIYCVTSVKTNPHSRLVVVVLFTGNIRPSVAMNV